ncbi:CRIB domain [Ceraceosorus bombacis]|uniref:CRIB domain n=1 Tax=Ceraceosorus bombacis TaxID=401625 RepID=A0A0P1BNM0_9BASI|nr:CRIB domain [Ceraceosorus bombacis]
MPALCRSAAAYDSLPRGQRKANAAIHRLRASQGSSRPSTSSEFGGAVTGANVEETPQMIASARPWQNPNLAGPSRQPVGKGNGLLNRRAAKAGVVLPLASSGSGDAERMSSRLQTGTGRRMEEVADADADADAGWATDEAPSAPGSPKKQSSRNRFVGAGAGAGVGISGPVSNAKSGKQLSAGVAAAVQHSGSPVPARKRVVDKRQIGLPSNFQHTGHIGAASYGQAVSQVDAAQLKAQLSEVAAALSNFDLPPLPESHTAAPPSTAPPTSSVSATPPPAPAELRGVSAPDSPEMEPLRGDKSPLIPADFAPVLESATATPDTSVSLDAADTSAPSIRLVSRSSALTSPPAETSSPEQLSRRIPPLQERPSVHVASIRRRPVPSTMGPSQVRASSGRGSIGRPYAALGQGSGAPSTAIAQAGTFRAPSTGGFGRTKRKPVPRGLAGILADPLAETSHGDGATGREQDLPPQPNSVKATTADDGFVDVDEDVALSSAGTGLERNVSLVGALPSGLNGRGYVAGGKGSWSKRSGGGAGAGAGAGAYGSVRGSVRMSALERAKLAAMKLEAAQRLVAEGAGTAEPDDPSLLRSKSGRRSDAAAANLNDASASANASATSAAAAASIRMNGKRMVQGPSGTYITDTANLRWNSALSEITRALKDGDEGGAAETAEREGESIEDAMRRADLVLGRLGVEQ